MDDGMTLDALRFLVGTKGNAAAFSLRRFADRPGLAIRFKLRGGGFGSRSQGWLLAEKSKRVRMFASSDTAFGVLRSMGVESFSVDLRPEAALAGFPRSLHR